MIFQIWYGIEVQFHVLMYQLSFQRRPFLFFFLTFFLKKEFTNQKFIHLKCIAYWIAWPLLQYNLKYFHYPRRNPYPLRPSLFYLPTSAQPYLGLDSHWSVSIDVHILNLSYKWFIQYGAFCDWLFSYSIFSKFIYVVTYISTRFLFISA